MQPLNYSLIDLTTKTIQPYFIPEGWVQQYLGGKGLAARILYEEQTISRREDMLIINTGLLTGTGAPSSSRFNVTFKSTMTGGIGTSNCGGNFGMRLRQAGFDGLIIYGAAEQPVHLEILDGEINIRAASHLWGLNTEQTQAAFPHHYGKLVIGPAGENLVRYACVVSEERVGGRGGLGAVFGQKNLKAVTAYGTRKIPIAKREAFTKLNHKWIRQLRAHPATSRNLPLYGTTGLLETTNRTGMLPVRNFTKGGDKRADDLTGEKLRETLLTRNYGCTSCVIRCGRKVRHGDREVKGPEYETVGLMGSNLENFDLQRICEMNYTADLMGMDTISLGATLGFAMEMKRKGRHDFGLEFGRQEDLDQIIESIAHRRGAGDELANGTRWLSERYGNRCGAIHVKGLELPAYDPRKSVGMGLGYATANRGGCHLNGGYLSFMEGIGPLKLKADSMHAKPELTIFMQNLMDSVSSAGSCLFTTYAVFPPLLYKIAPESRIMSLMQVVISGSAPFLQFFLKHPGLMNLIGDYLPHAHILSLVSGLDFSLGDFLRAGERIYSLERLLNLQTGLTVEQDHLPGRMSAPQENDPDRSIVDLSEAIVHYYHLRGWDGDGKPTRDTLSRLDIKK